MRVIVATPAQQELAQAIDFYHAQAAGLAPGSLACVGQGFQGAGRIRREWGRGMEALQEGLSQLERQFWTRGADFYREHLSSNCLMVVPGVGPMGREAVIEGIAGGDRWQTVEMSGVHLLELTSEEVILVYTVKAEREAEEPPYRAHVASVYSRRGSKWKLTYHQQTLAD